MDYNDLIKQIRLCGEKRKKGRDRFADETTINLLLHHHLTDLSKGQGLAGSKPSTICISGPDQDASKW
jgi:hypothetical protein